MGNKWKRIKRRKKCKRKMMEEEREADEKGRGNEKEGKEE
jgi:hypothetical protein